MTDVDATPKIRDIVSKHLKNKRFQDDTPLLSGGLLDSMLLVDVILDIETAFGVTIPTSEVQPDDFDSVLAIRDTIQRFR